MDGQKNKRIAFVTPRLNAYSETFIQAQIKLLPADIVLHNGSLPTMIGNKPIVSKSWQRINDFSAFLFGRELFTRRRAILHVFKKERIDVVLVQYGPVGVALLPVCKKAALPMVVHFHGFDASHNDTLKKFSSGYRELFDYVKAIIVVSKVMSHQLQKLGCPVQKIILNYYGVNNIFFTVLPDFQSENFLAIGRFVEKKGPEYTIRAFTKVAERFPRARLFMAGDGPLLQSCKELVKELSLTKHVFFPGVLKHEMVAGFMQKSLVFVQHSITASTGDSEGSPVVIMEASAASLPVISTFHAGIPDIIEDGVTGILVPEKDIDKMAEAMLTIISDKELAGRMGKAGRERIKSHFTMDRYIAVLRNVLDT